MKKQILIFFIMFLCSPIIIRALATNSSVDYSINVNVFYEDDCKDCTKLQNWLIDYKKEDNRVNVNSFNIKDNKKLSSKVRDTLNIKDGKTPLIIIGSSSFVGFNDKVKKELTKAIKAYEQEDQYCDIVTKVRNNESTKDCIDQNKDIYNNSVPAFIKIILVIVIGCFIIGAGLIIKKKKLT